MEPVALGRRAMSLSRRRPSSAGKRKLLRAAASMQARQNLLSRTRLRRRNRITAGYLGTELKYFDTAKGPVAIDASVNPAAAYRADPADDALNTVSQGDGPTNRDGKRLVIKSIYVKGSVYRPASEDKASPCESLRAYVALVLDRQTNGAAASAALVWTNPMAAALGNNNMLRFLEYSDRFRILKDQSFSLDVPGVSTWSAANNSAPGVQRHFEWFIPCNIPVNYNQTTPTAATVASIVDNSLHVYACATVGSSPDIAYLGYNARIRFIG